MKRRVLSVSMILVLLPLVISANLCFTQTFLNIQSHGRINYDPASLTVILRGVTIYADLNPSENINVWVDNYVEAHPYGTSIELDDMHQYGIWWYGYSFSQATGKWMGWTFDQLQTLIDRFHYHGWKVGLGTTGVAWRNEEEFFYIRDQHKELAFTDANGMRATGVDNAANFEKDPGYHNVIPDWFKKFETDDPINNIAAGTRLLDLYTTRLKQMILDGLAWDYWFGADGWNGLNIQGYKWNTATRANCYSFSLQEEEEWGSWTSAGMLPSGWDTMNNAERADAIVTNITRLNNWWFYWQDRFAQMYAQIRQAFIDAGRPGPYYTIGTADLSSEWTAGGNLSPTGMWNITLLVEHNAIDYFYVDVESTSRVQANYAIGREAAYAGALAKAKHPGANPIIGLQPVYWTGLKRPLWEVKQSYLAQATNYVWFDGARYRVSDPTIIMMQYPNATGWPGWTKEEVDELFDWIRTMASILRDAEPVWLGPVYPIPDSVSGAVGSAWAGINFSFAQWAETRNLRNNPQFISTEMGTLLLDEALRDSGPCLDGLYDKIVNQLWSRNEINLWYYEIVGFDWRIGTIWNGYALEAENNFHISFSMGSTSNYTVLSGLTDPVARWIALGCEGNTYVISDNINLHGNYLPLPGFRVIASYTYDDPDRIALGYYTNSSVGRFLLSSFASGRGPMIYKKILSRDMINKALYWVSSCPVNSSEPLIDLKVMNASGPLLIPMSNQRDVGDLMGSSDGWEISSVLRINAKELGLSDPSNYLVHWAGGLGYIAVSSWDNVQVTLKGMADILIIEPKI